MDTSVGLIGRLGWYARRLGSMTPSEMLWRGRRLAGQRLPRRDLSSRDSTELLRPGVEWDHLAQDFRTGRGRPLLLDRSRAGSIAAAHPETVAALVAAADRVRAGHVSYFGYPEARLATPIDWNHDPLSDFRWPSRESRKIDHRVAVADPKWIWELNRLQHLPWLAEAWLFTGDDAYAELALDHLETWMDQNPVGTGIAWRGAFEAGIRAISVAVALQGLRDAEALTPARFEKVVRMLAASADLCWRERSRFSSANNHLIGELAGLATVALLFPELAPAGAWEEQALRALNAEGSRQIHSDGAGAEQAVGYQMFTAELITVVAALLRARGDTPPTGLLATIDRSANYLAAVVGAADPDPRYGDDDEGFAVRLGPEPHRTVRDHLGIVAALTGNTGSRAAGTVTLTTHWLSAMWGSPESALCSQTPPAPANLAALDGGLVVLRSGTRRLTMDVGPLGYLSIAAHGHADALSVTVSLGGQEVIGDPGAASYYGHPQWRQVHRGTRVHPTVTVDDADQSVSGGPFLWSEHAHVRVRAVDVERGLVDAEHDGYRRLTGPVTHRRWLLAPPRQDASILIVDELSGSGEHEMRVSWPLHPSVGLEQGAYVCSVSRDGIPVAQIGMAGATPLELEAVHGDETTHLGWWSDRLEARVPSWLASGVTSGEAPLVVATVIQPSGVQQPAISDVAVWRQGEVITASWYGQGRRHTATIDATRSGAVALTSMPVN